MSTIADVATDGPVVPVVRDWPAWAVPARAAGEWLQLQAAIAAMVGEPVCRQEPELWWATAGTPAGAAAQASAVEACSWCPVLEACRSYALAAGERDGVWGGLTPAERRGLR